MDAATYDARNFGNDARTRRSESGAPRLTGLPATDNVPPPTVAPHASSRQWSMPEPQSHTLPPHLRWSGAGRTTPSRSVPPVDSSSVLNTIDKLLPQLQKPPNTRPSPPHLSSPTPYPSVPQPQLQRQVAPHLDPHLLEEKDRHQTLAQTQKQSWTQTQTRPRTQTQTYTRTQPDRQTTARSSDSRPLRSSPVVPLSEDHEIGPTEKQHSRPKNAFKERGSLLKARHAQAGHPKQNKRAESQETLGLRRKLIRLTEDLQDKMFQAGMGAQASFDYVLTSDYAVLLAEEFGRKPTVNDEAAFDLFPPYAIVSPSAVFLMMLLDSPPHPNPEILPNRPPVVTIMGHVDHGKTTLLDTLRSSSVAAGEVGGITQHIGAFSVPVPTSAAGGPQSITFLDTPGHAAFSAMRARGAQVTDIIVLVVAADDGVMPQTREVIELIKKDREKIGVVVAINKIDKPGCDVDALQKALLVEDIHLEEFGGDIPSVEVSGLTGKGLPDLVETISLISEIQDLRAEPEGNVFGYVLESKVVKGLGGVHHAKVRIMHDSNGKMVKTASPGTAVTVSGWKTLPNAGDEVLQGTESEIKRAIVNRQRKADIEASLADVEAINSSRQQERDRRQAVVEAEAAGEAPEPFHSKEEEPQGPKELRLLIKADVSGSAEAVEGALTGIGNHLAATKVISSSVGAIMESDVMMAKAVGGMIVGFSVSSSRAVELLAGQNGVPILTSDIIYRLMEDVRTRVIGLLPTTTESRVTGEAKVLQLFQITVKGKKLKTVAGSRVVNGMIEKNKLARVVRNGDVIFEGSFETMRHFKKDVTELRKGNECGLNFADFDELAVDDVIQTYETIELPGVL
ncbi:Translation initiation factor IF-2 [Mycena venus]|uniref:Translation initiation factor IF-2 n=1 Tax=Mycena venus TaxID=2733690 RepID=A0A8H6Y3R9_9AGAR|nr:Translation initiation factor IF-2 [Mycena venus]